MRIATIRSGGQSGADQGALDAARAAGVPIRGWCPKGGWAENFPTPPGVRVKYPELQETPSAGVVQRTEWNVRDSDATLIICPGQLRESPGTLATRDFAARYGKPCLVADGSDQALIRTWLKNLAPNADLNVAGPRESESPGIYPLAHQVVSQALANGES